MVALVTPFPNRESGSAEIRKKSKMSGKHPSDGRSYSCRVDLVVHILGAWYMINVDGHRNPNGHLVQVFFVNIT